LERVLGVCVIIAEQIFENKRKSSDKTINSIRKDRN
jgi:hypothetical protein